MHLIYIINIVCKKDLGGPHLDVENSLLSGHPALK